MRSSISRRTIRYRRTTPTPLVISSVKGAVSAAAHRPAKSSPNQSISAIPQPTLAKIDMLVAAKAPHSNAPITSESGSRSYRSRAKTAMITGTAYSARRTQDSSQPPGVRSAKAAWMPIEKIVVISSTNANSQKAGWWTCPSGAAGARPTDSGPRLSPSRHLRRHHGGADVLLDGHVLSLRGPAVHNQRGAAGSHHRRDLALERSVHALEGADVREEGRGIAGGDLDRLRRAGRDLRRLRPQHLVEVGLELLHGVARDRRDRDVHLADALRQSERWGLAARPLHGPPGRDRDGDAGSELDRLPRRLRVPGDLLCSRAGLADDQEPPERHEQQHHQGGHRGEPLGLAQRPGRRRRRCRRY